MAQHGTDYLERRALLREKILMMKALWTEEQSSHNGELLFITALLGLAQTAWAVAPSNNHGGRCRSEDSGGHDRILRRVAPQRSTP